MSKRYELPIKWRAFPLHPETPEEGMTLEALFKGRMVDISGMMARLRKAAAEEGLPFGERKMTYNSRLAQELGKWAETKGNVEAYNRSVFQAYFVHGRNIGHGAVLAAVAESAGLDPKEAESALRERPFESAVDADWERSRKMGIRAVPTFVLNNRILVGAQPETALDEFVRSGTGKLL